MSGMSLVQSVTLEGKQVQLVPLSHEHYDGLVEALKDGELSGPDKTYLAKLVAARTGLSQVDAEKRVDEVFAQAKNAETKVKQAADDARKIAAKLAIFTALSMMIGAFIAAAAAALGGAHRDEGWGYPRY